MSRNPATFVYKPAANETPTVFSVSPFPADHAFLQSAVPPCKFSVANSCRAACARLCVDRIALIICERHLPDGTWKDILGYVAPLPDPPRLIVTALSPDDQLWAEVLNLGGYDVLAKPFNEKEVSVVTTQALGLVRLDQGGSAVVTGKLGSRCLSRSARAGFAETSLSVGDSE